MGLAVGIDLGTTNSVVAISQSGRPRVLTTADGSPLIPSIVSFHPNGQTVVGTPARLRRAIDPTNTVFSVKRLLGRPFQSEEIRRAKSRFAFELREGPDAAVLVHTRIGDLSLPEISALVLREIRRIAEVALENSVDRAVVTVPANFNELQRTATKVAGQIADLDVIRILNEPTAAALAYGYGRGARERVAVYDFGGGTFDVTLLELSGNVFEVLATAGDTFLGGDDIDQLVTDSLSDALLQAHRIDARQDPRAYELLRAAAEQAKIDLSSTDTATIRIPEIGYASGGRALDFRTRITRVELEALAAPLVNRTFEVCAEALKLASMRPGDCSTVILVGGSSRIPAVRSGVAAFFGRDPLMTIAPEQVVGMGAAILAEALTAGRRQAAPAPAARQRTQTLRPQPPNAAGTEAGRSPPPAPATLPQGLPVAGSGPSQRVPTTPPRGGASPRATSGPAIRPRPTGEHATATVLQTRPRISTNPGLPGAPLPGDLTWGQSRPPEPFDDSESTRIVNTPSSPPPLPG
ncbi:MAG: Hsp70 family protein, partial [Deltaproteobacteria bacterium]